MKSAITFMIPNFPSFKTISEEDRTEIESFTRQYSFYSDFNFTSLVIWDTTNNRMVSKLNNNLIIRFTDYESGEPFFSFLGTNEIENTARELIDFAKKSGISPVLRFIPPDIINLLENPDFSIKEDRNNFDYVFSVSELAGLKGVKYKTKRHSAKKFLNEYPNAFFKITNISDSEIHDKIILLLRKWENNKKADKKNFDLKHEEVAIKRLLKINNNPKIFISCVLKDGNLIGFSIDEILSDQNALSHFIKADSSYKCIYDFLNNSVANYLKCQNIKLWNWEQDLGIESLRRSKLSHHPVELKKKYNISLTCKN